MQITKHIPNTITSMNLLCGALGVIFTFQGELNIAFYLMIAAAVCDFFDGFAARALKAFTPIGKDLDSLADVISFGLLPLPKRSDLQEDYAAGVNTYSCDVIAIPHNLEGELLDATCYALEAMAFFGKQLVTPEYYDRTLSLKRLKDDDSVKMLDLIFANRIYDMGVLYDPHHLTDKVLRITNDNTTGVASHWDEWLNEREDTLEKINDLYAKYNDPDYVADEE